MVCAMLIQAGRGRRGAGLGDDESDNILAPLLAWPTDDRNLGDGPVTQQNLFHLAWIDVAAARNDDVRRPVAQCHKTYGTFQTSEKLYLCRR